MKMKQINIETRTALVYLLFSGLWILLSDSLLAALIDDPDRITAFQTYKGWFFISASAVLIYSLLHRRLSEQRRLSAKLEENEERYRLLFNTSLDAILLTAPDGSILAANPAACRIFGRTEEEILQGGRSRLVDPADPRVSAALEERARSGYFMGELTFFRKDGSSFPGEISTALFQDSAGRAHTSMVIRDSSERKQAQDRILRLNRLYATLSQINQALVRVRDQQALFQEICRVTVVHGQFKMAWIGLIDEASQLIVPAAFAGDDQGYLDGIRITYQDDPAGRGPTGTAVREGRCVICEDIANDPRFAPWRENALRRGFLSSAAVPIQINRQIIGALMVYAGESHWFDQEDEKLLAEIGEDISFALDTFELEAESRRAEASLRRSEEQLRRLNAELEKRVEERTAALHQALQRAQEADRLKSAFLATMSHELRTPLNSIIGFSGVLAQGLAGPLNAEQVKQLGMISQSSHHLLQLINDILDLSKIEAGQLEIKNTFFDLRLAVEEVLKLTAPLAHQKGLAIQMIYDSAIGPVWSDRRRVEQVLYNLVGNAIKFTDQGEIKLVCQAAPDRLSITVADTGIGIRPEDIDTLFRPFQQIDSGINRRHEGSGLGLSICKNLVHLLGGEISVESQWGKGSRFTFSLPRAAAGMQTGSSG